MKPGEHCESVQSTCIFLMPNVEKKTAGLWFPEPQSRPPYMNYLPANMGRNNKELNNLFFALQDITLSFILHDIIYKYCYEPSAMYLDGNFISEMKYMWELCRLPLCWGLSTDVITTNKA